MTRIAGLCSGYEGLGMAVQSVLGGELAWVADNDPGAAAILAHRFPAVPNHEDITAADWSAVEPVDILTAGFPCQPVSLAGKRLGEADERWIWPAVARAVRDLRPGLIVLENVSALVVRGLAGVTADLAEIGYVGSWCCIRASDAGAPHRRERVFIVARPADADGGRWWPEPGEAWRRGSGWLRPPGFRQGPAADAYRQDAGPQPGRSGEEASAGPDDGQEWRRESRLGIRSGTSADSSSAEFPVGAVESDRDERQASERGCGDDAPADAERGGWAGRSLVPQRGQVERAVVAWSSEGAIGGRAAADTDSAGGEARGTSPIGTAAARRLQSVGGSGADWGAYAPAIARWETILGRPAPRPTEPGRTGERLSPRFVEWMMGLTEGWVTDVPGLSRNAQLKALGNGVVPQQAAMALRLLLPALALSEAA